MFGGWLAAILNLLGMGGGGEAEPSTPPVRFFWVEPVSPDFSWNEPESVPFGWEEPSAIAFGWTDDEDAAT